MFVMKPLNWKTSILFVATIVMASLDMSSHWFDNIFLLNPSTTGTNTPPNSSQRGGNMTVSLTTSSPDFLSKKIDLKSPPPHRPPKESVLRFHPSNKSWELIGDPQELLNFAYIGHSKCGSSTIVKWLGEHDQIATEGEIKLLWNGIIPAIQTIYELFPTSNDKESRILLQGYKQPNDIYRKESLEILKNYFPKTKLIVGIRHPVLWFESFYNFRVLDKPHGNILPNANELIGPCILDEHVCTDHARYAIQLEALLLLDMPNPIFLYDTMQLAMAENQDDNNDSDDTTFRNDLGKFLGISTTTNILPPPLPKIKPEKRLRRRRKKHRTKYQIDICDTVYRPVRLELMKHAKEAFYWFQEKLIMTMQHNHSRFTISSPDVFRDVILPTYQQDPCMH